VASLLKDKAFKQGIGVGTTQYQDPEKHWGRVFIDGMAIVTQVLAVVSMLLSAVLVSNTLVAIITQQTNQVGIMKAIGGGSLSVTKTYLAGVLIYCLLALLIAVPLGAFSSFTIHACSWARITSITINSHSRALPVSDSGRTVVPLLAGLFLSCAARNDRPAGDLQLRPGRDYSSNRFDRLVEKQRVRSSNRITRWR
jgi:putative ABC transport system permease protein